MQIEFEEHSRLIGLALSVVFTLAVFSGCHQRIVAPELTLDQSQVEVLDREIKRMDWE
jgi:hypothetical protein